MIQIARRYDCRMESVNILLCHLVATECDANFGDFLPKNRMVGREEPEEFDCAMFRKKTRPSALKTGRSVVPFSTVRNEKIPAHPHLTPHGRDEEP